MTTKNESRTCIILKTIASGNVTRKDIDEFASNMGVPTGQLVNTIYQCKLKNYVINNSDSLCELELTELGRKKLEYFGQNCNAINGMTAHGIKYGEATRNMLHVIESFGRPASINEIESKYAYTTFKTTFKNICHGKHVIETNGKYTLTEKGLQRLHILDMQVNEASECISSVHACANARIAEVKSQVTVQPTTQTNLEVVALSAPKKDTVIEPLPVPLPKKSMSFFGRLKAIFA